MSRDDDGPDPLTILYVDDEEEFRELTKRYLERKGDVIVHTAASAAEALNMLRKRSYDAIVSDYQMPRIDGVEFLKKLRSSGDNSPFILFTGKGREDVAVEAFESGADHYLQKGGDPRPQYAELLHKVHQTVRLNKAKHALWESEKRYRRLFQETPLGIINYDTHGTILDCNKRFVEIVGSSKKELLGLNMINDLVNKDVIEEIKKSLKSGKGYYEGLYTSMTAGKTTSLRAIFKGIKDTNGRIYAGLALIEDITERSKIEKDLRESERKYRTIIEKTPVGLLKFKMSPEGIFYPAFISNNIASFTGVSTSEAYEDINNLIEHIHPDHRDMIYNKMKHAEHNIGYDEFTIACNAKDGLRWLDVRVTPSREEDGTLVWDVVFMDITERKNAEEKLSSLATEYETVFTGTQDSMFLVEVVSDGFRYIRTNKSHQESTGFTLDDIMGKTPQELLGKRMGDVIASNYRRSIDTKGPVTYKETLDLPAGKKIWRTTLTPVFENGRARYIVGSSQDVTEHENALEALAQTADRQQVLLDNIDMQVWYMTDEHTYGMVNEAHAAFCCMRKEDLAYKDIREVCPKDISGFFQQSIEKVFSTGIRERGEVWVTNKSGEKRLLLMTKSPKANANSSVKYVICTAEDITEYREAEENAKASEMKYRSLVENLNDVVYILNEKAEVAYISPNIEAIGGYPVSEILNKSFINFVHPEDRINRTEQFLKVLSGVNEPTEYRFLKKDGSIVWVRTTARPIVKGGRVVGVQGVIIDITERKYAEQALRENEIKYRTLFEDSRDAIWFTSSENRVMEANSAAFKLLGYPRKEFIGIDAKRLYAEPSDREKFLERILENGFVKDYEVRLRHKDGSVVLCAFTSHVWRNEQGDILGYRGIVRNITESRRAEEALRESEEKYRLITENTADNISLLDFSLSVVYTSPSIEKIRGYSVDESVGQTIDDIMTPRSREDVLALFSEQMMLESSGTADPNRSFTIEVEEYHKNGSIVDVEITLSFMRDADGRPTGIIAVSRDITERKRAERALNHANKKLAILSGITRHDVNNRLTALMGYLELSLCTVSDGALRKYLERVKNEALTIREQIAFTKKYEEIGGMDPNWQDISGLFTSLPLPEGTEKPRSCKGILVYADPMLKQVFITLLDNSLRHGQTVTKITLRCGETDAGLLVYWEDNGIGIPESDKERIFERGYGTNTGLGLFLAKEILEITGISFRETGIPGKGARFEFLVPKGQYRMVDNAPGR